MAAKRPLVSDQGDIRELRDSDTLVGVGGGSVGVPFFMPAGTTFSVPLYQQVLFTGSIELDDNALIDLEGILAEVD